jgi:hypothetical protein
MGRLLDRVLTVKVVVIVIVVHVGRRLPLPTVESRGVHAVRGGGGAMVLAARGRVWTIGTVG